LAVGAPPVQSYNPPPWQGYPPYCPPYPQYIAQLPPRDTAFATVLSIFIPGAGQIYAESHLKGATILAVFFIAFISIPLIVWDAITGMTAELGFLAALGYLILFFFWIWQVWDAHETAVRYNAAMAKSPPSRF
jgi:hypothetical protein